MNCLMNSYADLWHGKRLTLYCKGFQPRYDSKVSGLRESILAFSSYAPKLQGRPFNVIDTRHTDICRRVCLGRGGMVYLSKGRMGMIRGC